MEKLLAETSLKTERGQTDDSLISERSKTDDSFVDSRKKTEDETDLKIKLDRHDADEAKAQSRTDTDANTLKHRSTANGPVHQAQLKQEQASDDRLQVQRDRDDAAVEVERGYMDAALFRERGINNFDSSAFLSQERKETDRNLLRERTHTDSAVERSSELFDVEQSSHSRTKAALTTRDEFLAIVSHDLRNPIGAILSYSELLLENSPREDNEAKHWAQVIRRNAQTSLRLISDILDMERFAEGKLNLNLKSQDINVLISQTIETFAHVAEEKNIILSAMPATTSHDIICDPDRITQVLANLTGNALKFTPKGGVVTLGVSLKRDDVVEVSITDTGAGIPREEYQRIFDRFAQIQNLDRSGLGLGLYISKMLVEAHRGRLELSSVVGQGSVFTFTLPRAEPFNAPTTH